jgi:pimeloyl-ACP methyl ester carboxylesterase
MQDVSEPEALTVRGHDGVPLRVWLHAGDGPPLLLTHCTGGLARLWDPLIPMLRPHFQVYAMDSRGHGASGQPQAPEAYAWSHSGHDVLAVIDALGLGAGLQAAGHSAGAAHLGYASWFRPGTFSRVVLIDAIIGPAAAFQGPNPLAESARRRRNVFGSVEEARERFSAKPPMSRWAAPVLEAYLEHGLQPHPDGVALCLPGDVEAWVYEHGGSCDLFEALHQLQLDALLLTGDQSNVRPLISMQQERIANAVLHTLPGVSHFIPQEAPEETARILLAWLREHRLPD